MIDLEYVPEGPIEETVLLVGKVCGFSQGCNKTYNALRNTFFLGLRNSMLFLINNTLQFYSKVSNGKSNSINILGLN